MGTFRGKEAVGWKVIDAETSWGLADKLNELNEKFDFIDCQYAIGANNWQFALVLLGVKNENL